MSHLIFAVPAQSIQVHFNAMDKLHVTKLPALYLDARTFRILLELQGPSLGLWRAAEVAALREQQYERPILDLGCGDGLVTSMVWSRVEFGLDPDENVLAHAARLGTYECLLAAAAEDSCLADESIGTIVSNSVLEHLTHIDVVLEKVARMLRPGGQLIFTVPTEAFSTWLTLPMSCYAAWRNRQLRHLNLWSTARWAQQLQRAGLEVEVVRPYLRRELVCTWDILELFQQLWLFRRRLVGVIWQRIPPSMLDSLAAWASQLDLSASDTGGGRLIVARKPAN
jgi:SAM-dependent methyltransferase